MFIAATVGIGGMSPFKTVYPRKNGRRRRIDTSDPAPAASTSDPEVTSITTSNNAGTVTLATGTQHPTMLGGEWNETTNVHTLINTNTKARPVLLSAGLAAGAHISDRIKQKIWADK